MASSSAGVVIWKGLAKLRTVLPEDAFAVGLPRLVSGRLFYGTGYELPDGRFVALPLPWFPGGPWSAAWSADGTRVAVLWVHADQGKVVELAQDGKVLREVWQGSPPPDELWSGAHAIVGIGRELQVFGAQGERRAPGHAGSVNAVSWSRDESRLLTVSWGGSAKLWATATWSLTAELSGDWSSGALAPDGKTAVLLTHDYQLHALCVDPHGGLTPAWTQPVAGQPFGVALGDGWILASFSDGPTVKRAQIRIACP